MTTPGRKPLPAATPVVVEVNHEALAQASQAADQLMALQAGYSDERDLLNQLLGQAQMADAIGKLTATVAVSKMAYVKESKLYQQLRGMKGRDGRGLTGTWEEFCGLLGTSSPKVNEDIKNLQIFGEVALESMSAMGIGYRELRQYRKLPEDQKLALIEVAKAGDKESFVELAEEIIAKHAKEKEATARAAEEAAEKLVKAQDSLAAKDRMITEKNELADSLKEKAFGKFVPASGSQARSVEEQATLDAIGMAERKAQLAMRKVFLVADTVLGSGSREAIELAARQAVEYLCQQLVDMATEFGIAVDFEQHLRPSWMDDGMLAQMEARLRLANGGIDADIEGDDDPEGDDTAAAASANVHHLSGSAR